ncbi:thioesterase [Terasakiella sp. A23]|uniref:acyl-[acyl-carrier-protein] thioesterase n=1 Tax=Terasakiella sp. FCG-A23 TaxID=3080561 RepID=UPI0029546E28|nr:acyl-ACP thioesterase domain-containing protein [Terasakiella sp. A23]MDV7340023.1 thioesterase [Terasakiella sp. A23]
MIDWAKVANAKAPPTLGQEIFHVRVSEICPNGLFSICSVAEYLQEAAFRNSTLLNLGMESLQGTDLAWVLARLAVFVRHYPRKGDAIAVETWYAGLQGKFGNRFYRLRDENNMVIATALTTFALFDLEERAMADWPEFVQARMPDAGPKPIEFQKRSIDKPFIGIPMPPFKPRLGDIDLYNHVNNTTLIEWALSSAAEGCKHPFQPRALDIVFRNECRLNDTVEAEVQQLNPKESLVLLSNQDNQELIRAHITR